MSTTNPIGQGLGIVLALLAAVLILPVLVMGVGMMGGGPMMGGAWHGGMWGAQSGVSIWFPIVGVIVHLLFVVAIVGGVFLLVRAVTDGDETDRAMEEARLAYARGDLTDDEFERRQDALGRDN